MTYRYEGVDRDGNGVGGRTSVAPAVFAERSHGKGWRSLRIYDEAGVAVGGIERHPDTRVRQWWGEAGAPVWPRWRLLHGVPRQEWACCVSAIGPVCEHVAGSVA